jgi:hypothetical protein
LFLGVVVLWAVYLVPLWARDRARAAAARQAQREADLLQVADSSQPRVVLTTGEPTLTSTARLTAVADSRREVAAATRARRRGRAARSVVFLIGLALAGVTAGLALGGTVAWWVSGLAAAWLATTTMAGAAAAASERRRTAGAVARARAARVLQPTVPEQSRSVPLFDRGRDVPDRVVTPDTDMGSWTPVEVPRPTYTLAPRVAHAPPLPWVDPAPVAAPGPGTHAATLADESGRRRSLAAAEVQRGAARGRRAS